MNQLKAQEVRIQQAHTEAEALDAITQRAILNAKQIEDLERNTADQVPHIQQVVDSATALLAKLTEQEQRAAAIMAQVQQHDSAAAQSNANAKGAAADVAAIADRTRALQTEIDSVRAEIGTLSTNVRDLVSSATSAISDLQNKADLLRTDTDGHLAALRSKTEGAMLELTNAAQARLDSSIHASQAQSSDIGEAIKQLATATSERLSQAEAASATRLDAQASLFDQKNGKSFRPGAGTDHQPADRREDQGGRHPLQQ